MTHLTIQQLVAHTDGELSGPSLKLVEKHIAECPDCWRQRERLAEQDALLVSVISFDPGEDFFEELAASFERETSGRRKPSKPAVSRVASAPIAAPPAAAPAAITAPAPAPAPPASVAAREPAPSAPPPPPPVAAAEPAAPAPPPETLAPAAAPEPVPPTPPQPPPAAAPAPAQAAAEAPAPATTPTPAPAPSASWGAEFAATFGSMLESGPAGSPPTQRPSAPRARPHGPGQPADDLAPIRIYDELMPRATEWDLIRPTPLPPVPRPSRPRPAAPPPRPRPAAQPPRAVGPPPRRAPAPAGAGMRRPIPAAVSAGATSPRRGAPVAVSIAIGAGAVVSGLAVAIVVMMRVFGPHGSTLFLPHPAAVTVSEVPDQPVPESAAAPGDTLAAPPTASPAPEPVAPPVSEPPPPAPGPGTHPLHAASRKPSDRSADGALAADPTVVVPVERIHTESQGAGESAPMPPPATTTVPAAGGEPAILCGQVIDPDGHPIVRAQVMMADVRVVALTDRSGRFCLTAPAGQRTLSVMALGFTSSRRVVTMGKRTAELTITLKAVTPFPTAH